MQPFKHFRIPKLSMKDDVTKTTFLQFWRFLMCPPGVSSNALLKKASTRMRKKNEYDN